MPDWDDTDSSPPAATYAVRRRTDPGISAQLHAALRDTRTVVSVGAGTDSAA